MNAKLAEVARNRAEKGIGPRQPLCCQRFVRLCLEAVYRRRYADYCVDTALHSAQAFAGNPPPGAQVFGTLRVEDTQLGDVLYCTKGHGGYGHTGIRVEGNRVAENSTRKSDRTHGAIGFCSLWDFGFDLVVRLPEP